MNHFYVYVLYRPWDDTPCYVGKGKGRRWLEHEETAHNHYNKHLANIFKKAARLGLKVQREKRYRSLTEDEALQYEIDLIKLIGRYPNGPLVNMTDGREGMAGHRPSLETRAKLSEKNQGRLVSPET